MAKKSKNDLTKTKELMAAMLRLPPKEHGSMRSDKPRAGAKKPAKKRASKSI